MPATLPSWLAYGPWRRRRWRGHTSAMGSGWGGQRCCSWMWCHCRRWHSWMVADECVKEELGWAGKILLYTKSDTSIGRVQKDLQFFLCRHSVQIAGWAGGFGVFKWYPVRSDAPATSFWMFWGGVHGSEANRVGWEHVFHGLLESHYHVDASKELPPWFLERQNITRRHPGHGWDVESRVPVGISNHAENAAMAIPKCQPWIDNSLVDDWSTCCTAQFDIVSNAIPSLECL